MQNQSETGGIPPTPAQDEISLVEIANAILRNWRVVVALPVGLAILVCIWTYTQPPTYSATATFIPQATEGRLGSGASALAQQFGVSLGSERAAQSPQFYVDLLQSLSLLRKAVETHYSLPDANGDSRHVTLTELYQAEPDSIPSWRSAVEDLQERISANVNQETSVIRLTVSAYQPALAEQVAERLLELLNEFNLEVRQNRAEEEGRFLVERVADAEAKLLAAESALQEFLRQNRQFENSPELIFEHDRLQRQVAMRQEVYTSLLRSQEEIRIDAIRDTPLLTVIDHPVGTAEPESRGLAVRVVLAFIVGLLAAAFIAFLSELKRRSRETDDPDYRELQGLALQAWEDVRQPRRWLGRGQKTTGSKISNG